MQSALILGALAALGWGGLAIPLTRAARSAGTWPTTFWMGLTSTVLTGIAAACTGPPGGGASDWALVGIAGVAYLANMVFYLMAVRGGEVSLVSPIIGCDGAFAAILAVLAGEALGLGPAVGLAAMSLALLLVTTTAGSEEAQRMTRSTLPDARSTRATVGLALLTAVSFGTVFFLAGETAGIDPLWIVATVRIPSVAVAFCVCARNGTLIPPPAARPWLLASGVIDALAFVCYVEGARSSLAIAAVAASQYATPAAIGGAIFFGERLRPRQWAGVAILIAAATLVAATA
jgi:uncharacterized membrane protein